MLTLHFSQKKSAYFTSLLKLYLDVCAYACFYTRYKLRMQIQRVVSLIPDNTLGRICEWRGASRKEGREEKAEWKELSQIRTIWWIVKGRWLWPPPRFGKWILPTGTCALLAVSNRRSCTNKRETRQGGNEWRRDEWYEGGNGNEAGLMEWKQI